MAMHLAYTNTVHGSHVLPSGGRAAGDNKPLFIIYVLLLCCLQLSSMVCFACMSEHKLLYKSPGNNLTVYRQLQIICDMFVCVRVSGVCLWVLFSSHNTCSTSLPSGNQVGGLLLVVNTHAMVSGVALARNICDLDHLRA